jgi:glycosyltransferase involved in cell wall biosynthesis
MKVLFLILYSSRLPEAPWPWFGLFIKYLTKRENDLASARSFSRVFKKVRLTKSKQTCVLVIITMVITQNIFSLSLNLCPIRSSLSLFAILVYVASILHSRTEETARGQLYCSKALQNRENSIRLQRSIERLDREQNQNYVRSYRLLEAWMKKFFVNSNFVASVTEGLFQSPSLTTVVKILTNRATFTIFKPYDKKALTRKIGPSEDHIVTVYNEIIRVNHKLEKVIKELGRILSKVSDINLVMIKDGLPQEGIMNMSKRFGIENKVFYCDTKTDLIALAQLLPTIDMGIVQDDSDHKLMNILKIALPVKAFEYVACGLRVTALTYEDFMLAELRFETNLEFISDQGSMDAFVENLKIRYDDAFIRDASKSEAILVEERYSSNKVEEKIEFLKC